MTATDAITRVFAVPPITLGDGPEPHSRFERGAHLVTHAEAAGDVTLVLEDPDALAYWWAREERRLGLQ